MNIVKHYHTRGDKNMTNNLPGWVILKMFLLKDILIKFGSFCLSVCGENLYGPTGRFTSPNYPNPNPHAWICEWTITVPEGRRVILTFTNLRLSSSPSCDNEHLIVSVLSRMGTVFCCMWSGFTGSTSMKTQSNGYHLSNCISDQVYMVWIEQNHH